MPLLCFVAASFVARLHGLVAFCADKVGLCFSFCASARPRGCIFLLLLDEGAQLLCKAQQVQANPPGPGSLGVAFLLHVRRAAWLTCCFSPPLPFLFSWKPGMCHSTPARPVRLLLAKWAVPHVTWQCSLVAFRTRCCGRGLQKLELLKSLFTVLSSHACCQKSSAGSFLGLN